MGGGGAMEGLIPFVIHAIKGSKKRSKYRSLSDWSPAAADMNHGWEDGGNSPPGYSRQQHQLRRAMSQVPEPQFQQFPSRGGAPASRSVREKPRPQFQASPRSYS